MSPAPFLYVSSACWLWSLLLVLGRERVPPRAGAYFMMTVGLLVLSFVGAPQ
jgi:hypothetical protein